MKKIQWMLFISLSVAPVVAHAGFMTGAVVGAAAGRMSCGPCEKTLLCIKQKLADPAWKGKESQVVDACEAENHHRSNGKVEQAPVTAPAK